MLTLVNGEHTIATTPFIGIYFLFPYIFYLSPVKCTWLEKLQRGKLLLWKRYAWTMKKKGYFHFFIYHVTFHLLQASTTWPFQLCNSCFSRKTNYVHYAGKWSWNVTFFLQFPITAIREIKILKKLHHENVIKLKEIVTSQGNLFSKILRVVMSYQVFTSLCSLISLTISFKFHFKVLRRMSKENQVSGPCAWYFFSYSPVMILLV